jgi:mannose/fructose/N-acetylgalactosamine-specific phosphotransferase system component IIB
MKKYLLLAVILVVSIGSALSQDKVLEKSGKQPKWINGLEKDFIIVVGTGASSQDAQQNALNMVKEQIVLAVAQNVKAKTEMKTEEANYNNNISVFLEKFASSTTSESGKVPFLQGISLSKVEEFYWEKNQKKDKSVYFQYHIKYPFPEFELKKLVSDFKMRDAELTRQLEDLLAQVETVESVEQIEKNMGELKVLIDYFMDGRKDQANLGITRYRSLLSSIELVELESNLGELKYALRLGTKIISTVKKPITKSECAKVTSTLNNQDHWLIKYDYSNCYEDPENNIMVKYRFGNVDVQKPFYFDVAVNKANIFVSDPFHFNAIGKGEGTVEGAIIDMTVKSKYDAPFTIDKVVIEWKGLPPVVIDGIGQSFSGKGNHNLKLNTSQSIKIEGTSSSGKALSLLSGYIYFRSNVTGEQKTYRIYNHSYTTDW